MLADSRSNSAEKFHCPKALGEKVFLNNKNLEIILLLSQEKENFCIVAVDPRI